MKKILLMILSIMFVILSCKTPTTAIDPQRQGRYISAKQVNGSSYLVFEYSSDGGFGLYYSENKETGEPGPNTKKNTATAENISGQDPNYYFQTGQISGTLNFISSGTVKITVNFFEEKTTLKDILCYNPDKQ